MYSPVNTAREMASVAKQVSLELVTSPDAVLAARARVLSRFGAPDAAADAAAAESVQYVFTTCRAAVLVVVREYRIRLFLPFCNPHFVNDYDLAGDELAQVARLEPVSVKNWWCNAGILCTRAVKGMWSTHTLPTYMVMFEEALRTHPIRRTEFIFNRRDHPLVRVDGTMPYHHVYGGPAPTSPLSCPLPVLSPYSSTAFRDRLVPTDVCWTHLGAAADDVPWNLRIPTAMFRGTATGSIRASFVDAVQGDPLFDAALTRSKGGRLRCSGGRVSRALPSGDADAWLPPATWSRYRVVLAIDGHVGLNRWGHLVNSGAHIIRVSRSVAPDTALASCVPHHHIDATHDGWMAELRSTVQRLVAGGPPVRCGPGATRIALMSMVSRSMESPSTGEAAAEAVPGGPHRHRCRRLAHH